MSSNTENNQSMFQDINRSVEQLCSQLSLANIKVPKPSSFEDIFEFLAEYELATTGLTDEQKKMLLARAFSPGRYKDWFNEEIAPLISPIAISLDLATGDSTASSWQNIKTMIIERFSETNSQDRHLVKLRDLKFDPEGQEKLLDFVENALYTYKRAFPTDKSNSVRFVKAAIPVKSMPLLTVIHEYEEATTEQALKKAAKRYDLSNVNSARRKSVNKDVSSELAKVLKEVLTGIQKEGESTRGAFLSVFKTYQQEKQKDDGHKTGYTSPRGSSPRRSGNNNYQPYRYNQGAYSPKKTDNNRPDQYQRGRSPVYNRQRSPSPRKNVNVRSDEDEEYTRRMPLPSGSQVIKDQTVPMPNSSKEVKIYSATEYFAKFGKPKEPCNHCGYWHWSRHCVRHLN